MNAFDTGVLVFFLLSLVALLSLKRQIRAYSAASFNSIAGGMSILALSVIARVLHRLGSFDSVPFVSEAVFYELAIWIVSLTGATLVVSGVSTWLPIARKHYRYGEARLRRLEVLQHVQQLIGVENRLDVVLANTLEYMVERFELAGGAVYKYSRNHEHLALVSRVGLENVSSSALADVELDSERLAAWSNGESGQTFIQILDGESSIRQPWRVLPVTVSGRPAGFFLLWEPGFAQVTSDDDLALRLAIDVVAGKIEQDRLRLRMEAGRRADSLRSAWLDVCGESVDVRESLPAIVEAIGNETAVSFAGFSILGDDGDILHRYSMGTDRQVLVESNLKRPLPQAITGDTFAHGATTLINDMSSGNRPEANEIVASASARSLLAVPVLTGGLVRAVLLLAAEKPGAFSRSLVWEIEQAVSALSALVAIDAALAARSVAARRLTKLGELAREMTGQDMTAAAKKAAELLSVELSAASVRIGQIEDGGAFIRSLALIERTDGDGHVPADGNLITSLMPIHDEVIRTGRMGVHRVAGNSEATVRLELRQMFGFPPHTIVVAPMVLSGRTCGTVSVALESPVPESEATEARDLIRAVSGMLATSMLLASEIPLPRQVTEDPRETEERSQLKSWLTGMLGSVELLNARRDGIEDEKMRRYLGMLDASAQKIGTYLRDHEQVSV